MINYDFEHFQLNTTKAKYLFVCWFLLEERVTFKMNFNLLNIDLTLLKIMICLINLLTAAAMVSSDDGKHLKINNKLNHLL